MLGTEYEKIKTFDHNLGRKEVLKKYCLHALENADTDTYHDHTFFFYVYITSSLRAGEHF